MRLNILVGGKAGQGIDAMASIISGALSEEGFYVFNYRDYPSLIRGGQNFNVLCLSDERIGSYDTKLDYLITLDEQTVEDHEDRLKEDGLLLEAKQFDIDDKYEKVENVFVCGVLFKKLGLDLSILKKELKDKFAGKEFLPLDLEAAETGYKQVDSQLELKLPDNKGLKTMTGSEGIAEGAIDAGIDVYFAYPMTPATPVLHLLAGRQEEGNFIVFQPENELGVVNAGLGSAHTGAKTMVGTSGGGYDLMQEAMSMQGIAEIPLVVYLAQRPGPGSGVPTYTTQGDLDIAVKGGHGEYPRVTIAPGDARESRQKANEAFYFAEKFRALSVLLGDKHVAESEYTFSEDSQPESLEVERNIVEDEGGVFNNYQLTEDGNSPRSVSGLTTVKSSSYEHDERGITIEDKDQVKDMQDKRLRKEATIEQELEKFTTHKIHGDETADIVVVGWGSTKGAIKDAVQDLDACFLQILYLRPFPPEVKQILENAEQVILVENNATGLLGNLIAENTGYLIPEENKILRYDGRPFTADKLRQQIKKRLN